MLEEIRTTQEQVDIADEMDTVIVKLLNIMKNRQRLQKLCGKKGKKDKNYIVNSVTNTQLELIISE